MPHTITRREAIAAAAAASGAAIAASKTIRLGGPIYLKSADPVELAHEHRRLGYSAAYCPPVKIDDKARMQAIEKAYAAENVIIAEVGVWVNLLDADAEKRTANLKRVTEGLAIADEVGARCCVDIAGSYSTKTWYGPDMKNASKEFFDAAVENARKIIDAVKPKRAKFAYEMMGWAAPDSPESYLALIKAIARPGFGVHIDIANGINSPAKFYANSKYIDECFAKLGKWVVSCHAKDLDWIHEMNVHFVEVVPGRGSLDYKAYLRGVASLAQEAPLMIEHLKTPEEYEEAKKYILGVAAQLGLKAA